MSVIFRSFAGRIALALSVAGSAAAAQAQGMGNPIVGAWTAQAQDQTNGGTTLTTEVYNPDGTFVVTSRAGNGNLFRMWGRYQVRQVGPNQMQMDAQVAGSLPRQVCSSIPGGATSCGPGPRIPNPPTMTVLFLDADTIQEGPLVSRRDPSPMLAQAYVPDTLTQIVQAAPAPDPGPLPNVGPQMCSLGQRQCFAHFVRTCETMATGGTWWVTSAVRCGG